MKFANSLSAVVSLLCLLFAISAAKAQDDDEDKIQFLPVTPDMETTAAKAMEGCIPEDGKISGAINKNGVYTLTGDLFHNGSIYTLIDDNQDVIICDWLKTKWEPIGAINVHTVWKFPEGYRDPIAEHGSEEPVPFEVLTLQNRPLVAIATYVEKQGQNYSAILFDSKVTRILDTAYSFANGMPEIKYGYLVSHNASRGKSDFLATYFSRIQNDKFVLLKSWEESVPWRATDDDESDSSFHASSNGKGYTIVYDNSKSSHPADYVISGNDPPRFDKTGRFYSSEKNSKPFAKIYFTPKKTKDGVSIDAHDPEELAYLFEKLTSLPREFYKAVSLFDAEGADLKKKIESDATIKVTGTKEAIKLLSR
jgi:hypothetical protein